MRELLDALVQWRRAVLPSGSSGLAFTHAQDESGEASPGRTCTLAVEQIDESRLPVSVRYHVTETIGLESVGDVQVADLTTIEAQLKAVLNGRVPKNAAERHDLVEIHSHHFIGPAEMLPPEGGRRARLHWRGTFSHG